MFSFLNRLHPLVRVPLQYAVPGGILGFVLVIVLYFIGKHPFMISLILDFRIALFAVFMYFILKELRDYIFGGILYFWQGLIATGLFTVFYAVVASGLIWIFGIIVPEFVTKYIELATNQWKNLPKESVDQIGQDLVQQGLAATQLIQPSDLAIRYLVQSFFLSFFISMIISVILRRQPQN